MKRILVHLLWAAIAILAAFCLSGIALSRGEPINNGDYMAKSTLLAIMGRMAAYTGQVITWEQAMGSLEDLSPPRYDWDVPLTVPPVAVPGQAKFV